ncbi:MAG: LPS assembly lipoprotein LptE [Planctomycetota bacterium]|nr:LPS assembly lipoprotein LptE [Planctomycetota bacterium]
MVWVTMLAGLGGVALLNGCSADPARGYSFNSTFDSQVRTISVPIFRNDTYSSGLEVALTEAIITEIQRSTPWRVVGPTHAATTLSGSIDKINMTQLTRQRTTGLIQEQALRVTISFDWVDNRSGQIRVSRREFTSISSFVPHRGAGEPLEVAQASAIRELARDIVAELRADW